MFLVSSMRKTLADNVFRSSNTLVNRLSATGHRLRTSTGHPLDTIGHPLSAIGRPLESTGCHPAHIESSIIIGPDFIKFVRSHQGKRLIFSFIPRPIDGRANLSFESSHQRQASPLALAWTAQTPREQDPCSLSIWVYPTLNSKILRHSKYQIFLV